MVKISDILPEDTIKTLLNSNNKAIIYHTKKDLLNEKVETTDYLWKLPEFEKIINKQQEDGTWKYNGMKMVPYPKHHYPLVATLKKLMELDERYKFNNNHPACSKTAEFIFSVQTDEGDIRGMIGNQYATYYTGLFLYLLIKIGYEKDKRVEKGLEWLLSIRQDDGGWTIPILTHEYDKATQYNLTSQNVPPVKPDRTKPFSQNWTNMILQAFASHKNYKELKEVKKAADMLKSSFFKKDNYSSHHSKYNWVRFAFWWPNILTALESLYKLGYTKEDKDIEIGLKWFLENQQENGLWNISNEPNKKVTINKKTNENRLWLGLRICRLLKAYYE